MMMTPDKALLGIAVTVGVAGSFALVRRGVSNILAGVAIAISLVPVLAVVGITLGSGRLDLAWGALVLFLTNAAAIIVASVVVFTAAGYERAATERGRHPRLRAKVLIAVLVVMLIIPLGAASIRTYAYESWVGDTTNAAEAWVSGTAWRIESVKQLGTDIVISAVGPDDPPPVERLQKDIRASVLASIGVQMLEGSGNTIDL